MTPAGRAAPWVGVELPDFFHLHGHGVIDSTNSEAKRLAQAAAPAGTLVAAASQSAGRGRQGRVWESPPGNLYASLVLRPDGPVARATQLSFVTALALGETVSALLPAGADISLKWPNDVLVGGRKVCGILLEAGPDIGRDRWIVIGTGLNLTGHPDTAGRAATSLSAEGAAGVTAPAALETFATRFLEWLKAWEARGFDPVRTAWKRRAHGVGDPLEVRLPGETLHGRFTDLDRDGALVIDMDGGGRRRITGGEVYFAATGDRPVAAELGD